MLVDLLCAARILPVSSRDPVPSASKRTRVRNISDT